MSIGVACSVGSSAGNVRKSGNKRMTRGHSVRASCRVNLWLFAESSSSKTVKMRLPWSLGNSLSKAILVISAVPRIVNCSEVWS